MADNAPPDLTLEQLRRLAGDAALAERGRELAERGAIVRAWRRGRLLLAHVQGSEPLPYSVTLEAPITGRRWHVECTCTYYEIHRASCKHAIAVLYLWITQPHQFSIEPTIDEELAGVERARWIEVIRESLQSEPATLALLALPPERARPLRRAINLTPYEEQLRYALLPRHDPAKQVQLAHSVLESAAGYQRIGDSANAVRIASLLVEQLLTQERKAFARLLQSALSLLELAALDADWGDAEHVAWSGRLFVWWGYAVDEPLLADRLLDLILHTYRPASAAQVIAWLRAQLRHPVHANQQSQRLWRARIRAFLLAYYEARADNEALLDLCWEEGDDRRAAITLARQGDAAEAMQLARGGLGDATSHRMVAELLAARGEVEAALTVAEAGRGYHDRGRAGLLTWLAQQAALRGNHESAVTDALAAWQRSPTTERYQFIRALDDSTARRHEMIAFLKARGYIALLVEILIEESQWDEAQALLPESGARRAELTGRLANRLSESHPERAMQLLFALADSHARQVTRAGYAQAVRAILGAQTVAFNQSAQAQFDTLLQQFKISHHRKSNLLSALVESGID